jgi:hypothetical protein
MLFKRVSYLDPPVCPDRLNQVAQRCLLTVRLSKRESVRVLGSDPRPSSRCVVVVRVAAGSSRVLRGADLEDQAVERSRARVGTSGAIGVGSFGCQRAKLIAAFRSRWMTRPQTQQEYVRSDRLRLLAASRGQRNTMVAYRLRVAESVRVCLPRPVQDRHLPVGCPSVPVTQLHQLRKGGSQSAQREFTPLTKRSACTIFAPRMFRGC